MAADADSRNQLEQLFLACDSQGTGFIGRRELRELCRSFDISGDDSDLIFDDLDCDGDDRISFQDFCRGFRDCVNTDFASVSCKGPEPAEGSGPAEPALAPAPAPSEEKRSERREHGKKAKKKGLRRRDSMHHAFKQFSKTLGEENVLHFIGNSQEKIHQLYQELVSSDTDPQIRVQVESVLGSLLSEVRQLQDENKHMEKLYIREKEVHEARLRTMEDELEAQVARVDSQARREAEQRKEQEIKQVEMKLKEEITELQMHLRMFQKVDNWLQKDNSRVGSEDTQKRLEEATHENRGLRMNLTETETSIALMRADMAQIRSQYEEKCRELHSERQQLEEYVARQEQVQRQLQVLQEANRRIQDTNDSLRQTLQDGGRPRRHQRPGSQMSSTLGDELDSLWDGESVRSHGSGRRPLLDDVQYGIPRLMHDLDSGLKDPDDLDSGLDRSVRDEAESSLDRSVREDLDELEAEQDNGIDECLLTATDQFVERRATPRGSPRPGARSRPQSPRPSPA
ncbi:ras and EF-hand domain-containing protein homolog, partial [Pollicipes pollicipes]|uniref:ras and EF-hand domain-containing protein homolog n=1 Tax=Pollicipes pollicipes TaxID=41117 RepID=UPI0018856124